MSPTAQPITDTANPGTDAPIAQGTPSTATRGATVGTNPAQTQAASYSLEQLRDTIRAEIDYSDALDLLVSKGLQGTVQRDNEAVSLPNVLAYEKLTSLHLSGVDLTLESSPKLVNKDGAVVTFGEFILENKDNKELLREVLKGTVFDENTRFCKDEASEKKVRKVLNKIAKRYDGDGSDLHNLRGFGTFNPGDRMGFEQPSWLTSAGDEALRGTFQIGDPDEATSPSPAGEDDFIVTAQTTGSSPVEGDEPSPSAAPVRVVKRRDPQGGPDAQPGADVAAEEAAEAARRTAQRQHRDGQHDCFFELISSTVKLDKPAIENNVRSWFSGKGMEPTFGEAVSMLAIGTEAIIAETCQLSARDRLKVVDNLIKLRDASGATAANQRVINYIGNQLGNWHHNNPVSLGGISDIFTEVTLPPIEALPAPITEAPEIAPLPFSGEASPPTMPAETTFLQPVGDLLSDEGIPG